MGKSSVSCVLTHGIDRPYTNLTRSFYVSQSHRVTRQFDWQNTGDLASPAASFRKAGEGVWNTWSPVKYGRYGNPIGGSRIFSSRVDARESASPMIQDFQQTTVASIGLLAQASTVSCGDRLPVSLAARQLELRRRFCSHICLRQSSQPHRRASPAIAIQSKNCKPSAAVTVDSYTTATGL